ncbi:UNKNOWN [Stylonychia lemnae]|uniref:Uncharacterized protein n=1 Tax=Stylonychia lemnae TaxID=5949 RepID=A0A078A3M4_STYLE|nr:UNKNOWN [Stylonychia lemnae]|eukprot:CDW76417.1 UNKNOWN [Stylonychia lemnae]
MFIFSQSTTVRNPAEYESPRRLISLLICFPSELFKESGSKNQQVINAIVMMAENTKKQSLYPKYVLRKLPMTGPTINPIPLDDPPYPRYFSLFSAKIEVKIEQPSYQT